MSQPNDPGSTRHKRWKHRAENHPVIAFLLVATFVLAPVLTLTGTLFAVYHYFYPPTESSIPPNPEPSKSASRAANQPAVPTASSKTPQDQSKSSKQPLVVQKGQTSGAQSPVTNINGNHNTVNNTVINPPPDASGDDPSHPPFYDLYDRNGSNNKVGIENSSNEYPAHEISVMRKLAYVPTRDFDVLPEIARVRPGEVMRLGGIFTNFSFPDSPGTFPVEIYLRSAAGRFYEQLVVVHLDSGRWLKALRVLKEPLPDAKVLFRRIDEEFPGNQAGSIEWPQMTPPDKWPTGSAQMGPTPASGIFSSPIVQ
jgi:hypothetical protein